MSNDDDTRPFPIQARAKGIVFLPSATIPWWLAEEAYAQYASVYGTGQTIERLGERGGFGRKELLDLLAGGTGDGSALAAVRRKRRTR